MQWFIPYIFRTAEMCNTFSWLGNSNYIEILSKFGTLFFIITWSPRILSEKMDYLHAIEIYFHEINVSFDIDTVY